MKRKIKNKKCYLILLVSLSANIFLLSYTQTRAIVLQQIIFFDRQYLGGSIKMLYHGEVFPQINTDELDALTPVAYQWLDKRGQMVIAHALGPMLFGGANSVPTFSEGIKMGFNLFEVDLVLTTDNKLICYHGENDEEIAALSNADYLQKMKSQGISPCYFEDLLYVVKQHPEIKIVLDVKNRFYDVYDYIEKSVVGTSIGSSFIPQIYYFDQLKHVRNKRLFAGEIFTSYLTGLPAKKIFEYAKKYNIKAVTLTLSRMSTISSSDLPADIAVFTHSIDDPFVAVPLLKKGIKGIYTSYITPDVLNSMQWALQ